MTEWNEFSVQINSEAQEAVSNIMLDLGSAGVSISDRNDFLGLPEYGFDTLWALDESKFPKDGVVIKGYFHDGIDLDATERQLKEKLEELKSYNLGVESYQVTRSNVQEEDWADAWKKYYHPVAVTRFLTIVPQWESYEKRFDDEKIITLDPGLAFGTGTHPTTQLCLQVLETIVRGGETIADVGTGSGVLSIGASHLGARKIYAYDLDNIAVTSAQSNLNLNDLDAEITVQANDLLKGIDIKTDIVVANILAEIIEPLIPDAMRVLNENGYFLSSGIVKEKRDHIIEKLEDEGFIVEQYNQMNDWVAILARKPSKEELDDKLKGIEQTNVKSGG